MSTTQEIVSAELEDVVGWRREQLVRAGYGEGLASMIAEELHIDLHGAVDLIKNGCPETLAAEILL